MTEPGDEHFAARLAGREPPELPGYFAVPVEGTAYHDGTMAPVLGLPVHRRASGLFVVGQVREPAPIDQFGVYLTATELMGRPLTESELTTIWDDESTAPALVLASAMIQRQQDLDETGDFDLRFVQVLLLDEHVNEAVRLIRGEGRRATAPQLQLLVTAGALLASPWRHSEEPPALTQAAYLGLHVGDLLGTVDFGDEILFGNVTAGLAADVVANQLFNSRTDLLSDIARHEAVWHTHVPQVGDPEYGGLADAFEASSGVSLEVFEAIGFALYTGITSSGVLIVRDYLSGTSLTQESIDQVMAMVSGTPDGLRSRLANETHGDLVEARWALGAFSQYPVLDFNESQWLIHSPQLLVDRFFSGLAFFDAWFPNRKSKHGGRLWTQWGMATERYGQEVLTGIAGDRVYDEDTLRAAYPGDGRRVCDAAVDYADTWVMLDFSSRRPTQDLARGASPDDLRKEVNLLVSEKAAQLQDSIDAVRGDVSALTNDGRDLPPRYFYPVVVVHSRWPMNPIMSELIDERLVELGLLQAVDVEPLQVLTIEELEMIEALVEAGGPAIHEILNEKRAGPLFRMGMKDHLLLVRRAEVAKSSRLIANFEASAERMRQTLELPE